MRRWMEMDPPGRWLVIESDPELRRIVIEEMEQTLSLPVSGCVPNNCEKQLDGAMAVVLPTKAVTMRKLLPAGSELTVPLVHPVAPELGSNLPARPGVLVGIASHRPEFQRIAPIMLIATGIAPESLLVRDATRPNWKRGLTATSAVVCDLITAAELPRLPRHCLSSGLGRDHRAAQSHGKRAA